MTYAFDPELVADIATLPVSDPADVAGNRAHVQEQAAGAAPPDLAGVAVEDRWVPGALGHPEVLVRIYRPEAPAAPAGVYNIHPGGFTVGSVETDHAMCADLARELGVVVVSVDYRLAPETPYPGPLEDVYAGLVWFAGYADELGVDPTRIAIHGTSAGAGLGAALTLLARDRNGPVIAFQYLAIPAVDDRLATASMDDFDDTPLYSRPAAVASWDAYLGVGMRGGAEVPVYAAPARATDLSGLPSAYVSVMHFDPLRDEGIAYALAMLSSGSTVELHLFPGTFHGSSRFLGAAVSRRDRTEKVGVLRHALSI